MPTGVDRGLRKILVIEDNHAMDELIQAELGLAGFTPVSCADSSDALFCLQTDDFVLILLDLDLRDPATPELMSKLCGLETPVICLADRDCQADQVRSLRLGADAWIGKPPEVNELLSGIRSVLRQNSHGAAVLRYQDIEVDQQTRTVRQGGAEVRLTPKEFDLLAFLIQHAGIALSREKILQTVWGYVVAGETRTVDMHIMQLRRKMNFRQKLKSVIKIGYRLDHCPSVWSAGPEQEKDGV